MSRHNNRPRSLVAVIAVAVLSAAFTMFGLSSTASAQQGGFHIQGGQLIDANGNEFIMRGVSHPHVWYQGETESFAEIKQLGANAVRVVLGSGQRWGPSSTSDVANVVSLCKQNRLICILEVHDTTGYGEEGAAATLAQAVDYWQSVQSALEGEEAYILINIGNEPFGNNADVNNAPGTGWIDATSSAIAEMRGSGFDHTLVVDAPNWGQDWTNTMRDNAAQVFDADPAANTMFSIHMYGVYSEASTITGYLSAFQNAGLPIMIGEFGHNHSDGDPDEDTIMSQAVQRGIGYIGWSYSGNSSEVGYLDMTSNFDPNSLTSWGQRIFNGANGIVATAQEATVYGGDSGDDQPPTAPGTPSAAGTTSNSVNLSWSAADDNVGVTRYSVVSVSGGTETTVATVTGNPPATSAAVSGLSPETDYTFAVYASDAAGNQSPRSGTVAVTTDSGPVGGDCTVSYSTNDWPGGFTAALTLTNDASTAIDGWQLRFDFTAGQQVVQGWSAQWTQSGSTVTASNATWNAQIASGQSVSFGFNGSWTGSNPEPQSFTLDGVTCTTA